MKFSDSLVSALRALGSVPDMETRTIEAFSKGHDEQCPLPDTNFEGDPVWRIANDDAPPAYFRPLITRLREGVGLTHEGNYYALGLADYEIVFLEQSLQAIIENASPTTLTPAETRLAIQLLLGQDLKAAAATDSISYETKRTQFKSLAGKLRLRGQPETVRVLTTHMLQALSQVVVPKVTSGFDNYAARFLPKDVRRLNLTTETGQAVPVLEYGPFSGKPVVVLHPMIFPPIGPEEIQQAHDLNLRLLWPLRPGLFDHAAPVLKSKDHLDASVNGLINVIERLSGQPTPVLALVSSGVVATRAAHARPDLVESICFAATCYSAGRSKPKFLYFGADLAELALRSEAIMTRTVAALNKHATDDERFRKICSSVFRGSERDLEHLNAEFDGADMGARLRSAILGSPESLKHDYFNQTHFEWSELTDLHVPVAFMQGALDSIHPPQELAKILAKLGGKELSVAADMGHLPHFADLRQTIDFAFGPQNSTTR